MAMSLTKSNPWSAISYLRSRRLFKTYSISLTYLMLKLVYCKQHNWLFSMDISLSSTMAYFNHLPHLRVTIRMKNQIVVTTWTDGTPFRKQRLTYCSLAIPYGRHSSRSTLAHCLTTPSHYLDQYWLITSTVLWHSPKEYFIRDTINQWNEIS